MTIETMTTKTRTTAPVVTGPKIKTALPGPNAKRVLEGDREIHFAVLYPLVSAWSPRAAAASLSPTWTETSSLTSPPASP